MPHPSTSSAYGIWSLNEVRDAERGDNWPRLPVGFALSSAVYDSVSFSVASQEDSPLGLTFNSTGTKMFIVGSTGDDVNEYALSTAFDISTASFTTNFSVSSQETIPTELAFNGDGTKMFILGYDNSGQVSQYSLSTGFDVSTASYDSVNFSVSSQTTQPLGMTFNNDGTKMYVSGSSDIIYQYSLSTGFDMSTASYDSVSFSVTTEETNPNGIVFNTDGTKLFVVGSTGDDVGQYTLSTAFDISTASFDSISFSVASQDTSPQGIAFNNNGSKMYIIGTGSDAVYQYTTEE